MADWAGKLFGAIGRISGLIHLANQQTAFPEWTTTVSAESVTAAIEIGQYFTAHALAAYRVMGSDPSVDDAKYMLRHIQKRDVAEFKKVELFDWTKGRFHKVVEMEPALELLEAHGYVARRPPTERRGPRRPPSPTCDVNPQF